MTSLGNDRYPPIYETTYRQCQFLDNVSALENGRLPHRVAAQQRGAVIFMVISRYPYFKRACHRQGQSG